MQPSSPHHDVILVGAGFVGSIAAILLHRRGVRVLLLDRARECPDVFRAEKLEPDQSRLLHQFGLLDRVRPGGSSIDRVHTFVDGGMRVRSYNDQYGMRYADTVNSLRRRAAATAGIEHDAVVGIDRSAHGCVVHTASGHRHAGTVCVLACGSSKLLEHLGVEVERERLLTSLTFGFDVAAAGETRALRPFNYHAPRPDRSGVHYVTFFPIGERFRVNLFTAWDPSDACAREVLDEPVGAMHALFPRLHELLGGFVCTTPVQVGFTRYHRVTGDPAPGVVVLGEAYQSVSPATGMGLSKCLTDVRVLLRHLPEWLAGSSVSPAQVEAFYRDPEKARVDDEARDCWRWFRDCVSGRSLRWRVRRSPVARGVGCLTRWVCGRWRRAS